MKSNEYFHCFTCNIVESVQSISTQSIDKIRFAIIYFQTRFLAADWTYETVLAVVRFGARSIRRL